MSISAPHACAENFQSKSQAKQHKALMKSSVQGNCSAKSLAAFSLPADEYWGHMGVRDMGGGHGWGTCVGWDMCRVGHGWGDG